MSEDWKNAKSVYDFTVKDIQGEDVSLEKYKYANIRRRAVIARV